MSGKQNRLRTKPDLLFDSDSVSEKALSLSEPQCCQSVKLDDDLHRDFARGVERIK